MTQVTTVADIGSAIAVARKAAGLSQSKLAVQAATSQAVVSEIERGKETAQIGVVVRLMRALSLVVDIRPPGVAAAPKPTAQRAENIVFDEPLPDDSINLDAIVSGTKPKAVK